MHFYLNEKFIKTQSELADLNHVGINYLGISLPLIMYCGTVF